MKVFFDMEFTGLHQNTTLISIGCVAENGQEFYAEFVDYDVDQVNDWIRENVIENLLFSYAPDKDRGKMTPIGMYGNTYEVHEKLTEWLEGFGEQIEMWSDVYAYDWVLFNNIWGHAFHLPKCVYYMPFDIATLFQWNGIDPDVNREEFAGMVGHKDEVKHNALWDAVVIMNCYRKMLIMKENGEL